VRLYLKKTKVRLGAVFKLVISATWEADQEDCESRSSLGKKFLRPPSQPNDWAQCPEPVILATRGSTNRRTEVQADLGRK
jgi:hypothetical protein